MKTYASILTLALISGCASTQVAQNECRGAGYAPGTVGYANCYERSLERQDQTGRDIASAIVLSALTPRGNGPPPIIQPPVFHHQPDLPPVVTFHHIQAPALPQRHYQHDFTATIGPRGYRNR
jgi:hypothetical protein